MIIRYLFLSFLFSLILFFLILGAPALFTSSYIILNPYTFKGGGSLGYKFGYVGSLILLLSMLYSFKISSRNKRKWLNLHCNLSIVGSILILIHSGFPFSFTFFNPFEHIKLGLGFEGLVGVQGLATWFTLFVLISGIFGKYLYSKFLLSKIFKAWLDFHVTLTGGLYVTGLFHLIISVYLKHTSAI